MKRGKAWKLRSTPVGLYAGHIDRRHNDLDRTYLATTMTWKELSQTKTRFLSESAAPSLTTVQKQDMACSHTFKVSSSLQPSNNLETVP
jgi:hypothetical protein